MLAPISWRVPPRNYGPWEQFASLLTEGLVERGVDVTPFPTADSTTRARFFGGAPPRRGGPGKAPPAPGRAGGPRPSAASGRPRRYFEQLVEPRIDGERVRYLGPVGPDRRGEMLGGARALLHLVNFDEPFGFSVVEAMACGTPVIASARGSMPEIVRNGESGFLVGGLDEAVAAVGRVEGLDRAAVRASVERRFPLNRMVHAYLALYPRIAN